MRNLVIILLILLNISILFGTEIYGTIDIDTTIGPEGNPWYVPSNLWIGTEATLTILQGTAIYITAVYTNDFWNFAALGNEEAEAKVINIIIDCQSMFDYYSKLTRWLLFRGDIALKLQMHGSI